jgi:hypothetical protein
MDDYFTTATTTKWRDDSETTFVTVSGSFSPFIIDCLCAVSVVSYSMLDDAFLMSPRASQHGNQRCCSSQASRRDVSVVTVLALG